MLEKTVFVGLSGGVDSSTTAYLLQKKGYRVVGVYMKNWSQDVGGYECPWLKDYQAAKRLASFLKIKFLVFDFQKEYRQLVVEYMIDEYRQGRTPNPDIKCNQEIKFNLFLKACLKQGADLIATGHYANLHNQKLYQAQDKIKDQTYFLYKIPKENLSKIIFPLGNYLKREVRQLAQKARLPNANRRESMGICFVGSVGLVDFLKQYVKTKPGLIIDDKNQVVGRHQGAIFYTLGQRQGLNINNQVGPYYVIGKNMAKNEVYVSNKIDSPQLWCQKINLRETYWLESIRLNRIYQSRLRHGGRLIETRLTKKTDRTVQIKLKTAFRAPTPGQSVVFYLDNQVIGGGIIDELNCSNFRSD